MWLESWWKRKWGEAEDECSDNGKCVRQAASENLTGVCDSGCVWIHTWMHTEISTVTTLTQRNTQITTHIYRYVALQFPLGTQFPFFFTSHGLYCVLNAGTRFQFVVLCLKLLALKDFSLLSQEQPAGSTCSTEHHWLVKHKNTKMQHVYTFSSVCKQALSLIIKITSGNGNSTSMLAQKTNPNLKLNLKWSFNVLCPLKKKRTGRKCTHFSKYLTFQV